MSQGNANTIPCDGSSGLPLIDVLQGPVMKPILTDESQRLLDSFVFSVSSLGPITNHRLLPVPPRLILHGSPGTGKSLTAYHTFSKINLTYCFVKLDAVISPYVGETAKNVQNIFAYASQTGLGIIFDQIDVFARARSSGDESQASILTSSFLNILDKSSHHNVPIVATTNRFDLLDTSIFHRFPFQLEMKYPDLEMRRYIWNMYYRPGQGSGEAKFFAEISDGFSGADIRNISCSSLVHIKQMNTLVYMEPIYIIRALSKSSTNHCVPCSGSPINISDNKPMSIFLDKQGIERDRISKILSSICS